MAAAISGVLFLTSGFFNLTREMQDSIDITRTLVVPPDNRALLLQRDLLFKSEVC